MIEKKDIRTTLFSIPVEGAGEALNRLRSEGPVGIVPKVAIVSLLKALERSGYPKSSYDFYDMDMLYPADDEIYEYLNSFRPHIVGLSAVVSTSYSQVKRVVRIIKEVLPGSWIVVGGNLSASAETVLRNTAVDLVVCGDGELALVALVNLMLQEPRKGDIETNHKLAKIPGVAFLENGELRLNGYGIPLPEKDLVYPDYELLAIGLKGKQEQLANYFRPALGAGLFHLDPRAYEPSRRPMMAGLFTSKGCTTKCTFCQRGTKGYRIMSVKALENHIIELKTKFNVGFIKILDESFGSNKNQAYQIAEVLHKHDMLWFGLARCKSMNDDDIAFYKSRGCSAMQFGIESGSQKMLDVMEKKFNVEDIYSRLESTNRHGIYSPLSILTGMPGETEETARETGQFLGKLAAMRGAHPEVIGYDLFYAMPFQGSPLWEYGQQIGAIPDDSDTVGSDKFLMDYSYCTFYKRYYINLNGAPAREVVFWEYIIRMEASRSYRNQLEKFKSQDNDNAVVNVHEASKERAKYQKTINPRHGLKYTAIRFTWATYLVDNFIIGNPTIDRLPRAIIYPLVKNLLYIEYLIQRMYKSNRRFAIYTAHSRNRTDPEKITSLRKVVQSGRLSAENQTSLDRIRISLNAGL